VNDGKIDWSRFGVPVMGRPRVPPDMAALQPALDKCLREKPPIEKTTPPPPNPFGGQVSSPDRDYRQAPARP